MAIGILESMIDTADEAVQHTYAWFEVNSGWAPPDNDTLREWVADGVCRCPDDCIVAPDAWCEHGLASWWLISQALDRIDERARHRREAGQDVHSSEPGGSPHRSGTRASGDV